MDVELIQPINGLEAPTTLFSAIAGIFQRLFSGWGFWKKTRLHKSPGGLLKERVPVDINRKIFDYDLIVILGPVFPHEVVGYSGGAKYLFPGISGGYFLHFFHWLGAVITCEKIIGMQARAIKLGR